MRIKIKIIGGNIKWLIKNKSLKQLKEMSVLELNDLVKAIEEEFGVTAAAPVAAAGAAGGGDAAAEKLNLTLS